MTNTATLIEQFEEQEIHAPDFHHIDHIKVAYGMLDKYDFIDATNRYASTIRTLAERNGVPEKFNTTITFAFMSLVAERKAQANHTNLDTFLAANPDLLDKSVLGGWYTTERLTSVSARNYFLLPNKGGN